MLALLVRSYHLLRIVGIAFAVAGTLGRLVVGSMIEVLPAGIRPFATDLWNAIMSWPVYATSLLLAGAWLQDWFDARLRSSEGHPSWFGIRALRGRLMFTSWIIGRPKLYADEYKIRRELERADAALLRAGFETLEGLPRGAGEDVAATKEYLASIRALIPAVGVEPAAQASTVLKRRLLGESSSQKIRQEDGSVVGEGAPRRPSIADALPWPFGRRR